MSDGKPNMNPDRDASSGSSASGGNSNDGSHARGPIVFRESGYGRIIIDESGAKPAFLASEDTIDPAGLALAEMLFWLDIEAEHAWFMARSLPAEEMPQLHRRATGYYDAFSRIHEQCQMVEFKPQPVYDFIKYVAIPWAEEFLRFKIDVGELQKSGQIHSLTWPSFLGHIARENGRFIRRMIHYRDNDVRFSRRSLIDFWAPIMAEHLSAMAHQLDPEETLMFDRMMRESRHIDALRHKEELIFYSDPVLSEVEHVIDFKSEVERQLARNRLASMIAPGLADHARREALLFKAELMRADAMMGAQEAA